MPPRAMEIPISLPGAATSARQLGRLAGNMERLAEAHKAMRAELAQGALSLPTVAGGGTGTGGRGASARTRITGPMNRLVKAQQDLHGALLSGTMADIFDAQEALARAHGQVARARSRQQGPGRWQALQTMILSTRFNLGGRGIGASPLIGRSLAALGLQGGSAAMVGAGVGAAVIGFQVAGVALREFTRQVGEAARTVSEFGQARTLSGGTTRQIAALQALGVQDIAGQAGAFRERISSDPTAMLAAAQLGVRATPRGLSGTANEAAGFLKMLEGLRNITADLPANATAAERLAANERQLRLARVLGQEAVLDELRVSERVWQARRRDIALRERLFDPATEQSARDLRGEMERLTRAQENLQVGMTRRGFGMAGRDIGQLASNLNTLTDTIDRMGPVVDTALATFRYGLMNFPGMRFLFGNMGGTDPQTKATQDNTKAVQDLSSTIKQTVGGGPRAANALPPGLSGDALRRALENDSLQLGGLGAFSM